jgi:AcrR family transcriptional regulator
MLAVRYAGSRDRFATRSASSRQRARKEGRRSQILDAAFQEFSANGFEATHLDEVARRAGVAKGTIYLYFRDKEQLFRAMVRTFLVPVIEGFRVSASSFSGSVERLARQLIGHQYVNLVNNAKTREILRMLIAESHRFPQLSEIWYREAFQRSRRVMRSVLAPRIASGEIRKSKVCFEYPFMLGAPGMLAVVWKLMFGDRHPLDLDAYREAHLDLILHGLKERPPGRRRERSD